MFVHLAINFTRPAFNLAVVQDVKFRKFETGKHRIPQLLVDKKSVKTWNTYHVLTKLHRIWRVFIFFVSSLQVKICSCSMVHRYKRLTKMHNMYVHKSVKNWLWYLYNKMLLLRHTYFYLFVKGTKRYYEHWEYRQCYEVWVIISEFIIK